MGGGNICSDIRRYPDTCRCGQRFMLLLENKVDYLKPFLSSSLRNLLDFVTTTSFSLAQTASLHYTRHSEASTLTTSAFYVDTRGSNLFFFFFTGTFLTDRTKKKINVDQIDFSWFLPVWTTAWWNLSCGRNNLTFSTDSAIVCPAMSSSESPLHVWGFIWRLSNVQSGNTHFLNFLHIVEIWKLNVFFFLKQKTDKAGVLHRFSITHCWPESVHTFQSQPPSTTVFCRHDRNILHFIFTQASLVRTVSELDWLDFDMSWNDGQTGGCFRQRRATDMLQIVYHSLKILKKMKQQQHKKPTTLNTKINANIKSFVQTWWSVYLHVSDTLKTKEGKIKMLFVKSHWMVLVISKVTAVITNSSR